MREEDRDPLDTLRSLRDCYRDTVGLRASDLARFEVRRVEDTLADLDRYRHDRLVSVEADPMGTVWYDLTDAGRAALAEADAQRVAPPAPTERLL